METSRACPEARTSATNGNRVGVTGLMVADIVPAAMRAPTGSARNGSGGHSVIILSDLTRVRPGRYGGGSLHEWPRTPCSARVSLFEVKRGALSSLEATFRKASSLAGVSNTNNTRGNSPPWSRSALDSESTDGRTQGVQGLVEASWPFARTPESMGGSLHGRSVGTRRLGERRSRCRSSSTRRLDEKSTGGRTPRIRSPVSGRPRPCQNLDSTQPPVHLHIMRHHLRHKRQLTDGSAHGQVRLTTSYCRQNQT